MKDTEDGAYEGHDCQPQVILSILQLTCELLNHRCQKPLRISTLNGLNQIELGRWPFIAGDQYLGHLDHIPLVLSVSVLDLLTILVSETPPDLLKVIFKLLVDLSHPGFGLIVVRIDPREGFWDPFVVRTSVPHY